MDNEQRTILSRIASRLLNLRAGTPITHLRKTLGSRRTLLDELLTKDFLRIVGGLYLPTFRGIENLEEDIRRVVRENIGCVLGALQGLYRESLDHQYTFGFDAVIEKANAVEPTFDANDGLPALLLGEQFGYHYFQSGIREHQEHLTVETITVHEKILDFASVDASWAAIIAQDEAYRIRVLSGAAQVHAVGVPISVSDLPPMNFTFMQNTNLAKIVQRDYGELQRVRGVDAAKSRYVLCGGIIEGLLLDVLLRDEGKTKTAKKAPKLKGGVNVKPLADWNLGELLDVALELNRIETDAEQFSHGVRNYRNLIHPGKEMQSNQKVALEEADIAEKVVEIIIRELRQQFIP